MRNLLVIFQIFIASVVMAGGTVTPDAGSLEDEANKLFNEGHYIKALEIYTVLDSLHPENLLYKFRRGICYTYKTDEKEKSLDCLNAVKRMDPSYPEINFYLGRAHSVNYKFDQAITFYNQYLKEVISDEQRVKTKRLIEVAENGIFLVNTKVDAQIQNIGPVINSEYSEYCPVISSDEAVMIFTYRGERSKGGLQDEYFEPNPDGEYYEDIFISYHEEGIWTAPEPVGDNINTLNHDAAIGLSPDGSRLLVFRSTQRDKGDIYESRLYGRVWTEPVKLNDNINTRYWEGSASISGDGKVLYFSSERPGGFGGRDIYRSVKQEDGSWGKAINAGPVINTIYNDDAPFIHVDDHTLFFCSEGHNTMGGYDIFKSVMKNGAWSEPVNVGYPINSTADDVFYVVSANGERGYYSTDKKGGTGGYDIYVVSPGIPGAKPNLALVKGMVHIDNIPASAKIRVRNLTTGKDEGEFASNEATGKYMIPLPPGNKYLIEFEFKGMPPHSENIDITNLEDYVEVVKEFKLDSKDPAKSEPEISLNSNNLQQSIVKQTGTDPSIKEGQIVQANESKSNETVKANETSATSPEPIANTAVVAAAQSPVEKSGNSTTTPPTTASAGTQVATVEPSKAPVTGTSAETPANTAVVAAAQSPVEKSGAATTTPPNTTSTEVTTSEPSKAAAGKSSQTPANTAVVAAAQSPVEKSGAATTTPPTTTSAGTQVATVEPSKAPVTGTPAETPANTAVVAAAQSPVEKSGGAISTPPTTTSTEVAISEQSKAAAGTSAETPANTAVVAAAQSPVEKSGAATTAPPTTTSTEVATSEPAKAATGTSSETPANTAVVAAAQSPVERSGGETSTSPTTTSTEVAVSEPSKTNSPVATSQQGYIAPSTPQEEDPGLKDGLKFSKSNQYKEMMEKYGSETKPGVVYEVELFAQKANEPVDFSSISNLGEIKATEYPDGTIRYTIGNAVTMKEAETIRNKVIQTDPRYAETFVTVKKGEERKLVNQYYSETMKQTITGEQPQVASSNIGKQIPLNTSVEQEGAPEKVFSELPKTIAKSDLKSEKTSSSDEQQAAENKSQTSQASVQSKAADSGNKTNTGKTNRPASEPVKDSNSVAATDGTFVASGVKSMDYMSLPVPVYFADKDLNNKKYYAQLMERCSGWSAEGLIFKVQIGAYRHPQNFKYDHLSAFGPAEIIPYPDGITRFTMREFTDMASAEEFRQQVISRGTRDAWITAVYKGKRMLLQELILNNFYQPRQG